MARIKNFKVDKEFRTDLGIRYIKSYKGIGPMDGYTINTLIVLVQQNGGNHYNVYVNVEGDAGNMLVNKIGNWNQTLTDARSQRKSFVDLAIHKLRRI